jgi:uncharacterized repeat protein (TIGR04076 family)
MRARLKITVIRKLSWKDIHPEPLPHVSSELTEYCDRLEVGREFIVEPDGNMPAGFCTWAWHDIYPEVTTLRFGGNFPWFSKDGLIYSCCTDGVRPVFFKIERI